MGGDAEKLVKKKNSNNNNNNNNSNKEKEENGVVNGQQKVPPNKNNDDLTWEELQVIEKRRRRILGHGNRPFFRILLLWEGTVLNALLHDPLIYTVVIIYALARVAARFSTGIPDNIVNTFGGAEIGIIGGFLSFFLVFYVSATTTRYNTLYDASMACEGRIFDAAALAKICLPRERALRLVRYMNAAHIAGYIGVSETYQFDNFFVPINRSNRLLTDREVERMKFIDMDDAYGSAYQELIVWCLAEIETAHHSEFIGDHPLGAQLRTIVLALRDKLATLYNFHDQPVPFFYVHFVCLVSAFYLPLFAVKTAFTAGIGDNVHPVSDVVSGLIVLLQLVHVIGLRLLANKLANPYGHDDEDLSVMHYISYTWFVSRRMLEAERPEFVDAAAEEGLCQEQQDIGKAWRNPPVPDM